MGLARPHLEVRDLAHAFDANPLIVCTPFAKPFCVGPSPPAVFAPSRAMRSATTPNQGPGESASPPPAPLAEFERLSQRALSDREELRLATASQDFARIERASLRMEETQIEHELATLELARQARQPPSPQDRRRHDLSEDSSRRAFSACCTASRGRGAKNIGTAEPRVR